MLSISILFLAIIFLLIVAPHSAMAYIGPGAGITAFGTVIVFIFSILLAIIAFLWYPIKRLLSKIKKKNKSDQRLST